jgi:hypothetical protein
MPPVGNVTDKSRGKIIAQQHLSPSIQTIPTTHTKAEILVLSNIR